MISWIKEKAAILLNQPQDLLVLRMTLLLLVLHGSSTVVLEMPLRAICGLMLLSRSLVLDKYLWFLVCALMMWINALNWAWIDNHKFLITYWCMACAFAVASDQRAKTLAKNGRLLVGGAFLFAMIWKIGGGQFHNGDFLHYTFLTDSRLETFANFTGGLEPGTLFQNRLLQSLLMSFPEQAGSVTLSTSSSLALTTLISSYWTLLIEGAVAICFLFPKFKSLGHWRDICLMIFIVTTYGLLPVTGFAFVLCVMGLAQAEEDRHKIRLGYFLIFIAVQFIKLPWSDILLPG